MEQKKGKITAMMLVVVLWLALALWAWLRMPGDFSDTERRPLAEFPTWSTKKLQDGSFMSDFEEYTLDQFPLRDGFRRLKALVHYNILRQKDNNGIYIADGYAAEMEYPLDETSVKHALQQFQVW